MEIRVQVKPEVQAYHRHLWLPENALSGVEVEQLRALIDANQEAQDEDGQEP
jgi:hypothetical protein